VFVGKATPETVIAMTSCCAAGFHRPDAFWSHGLILRSRADTPAAGVGGRVAHAAGPAQTRQFGRSVRVGMVGVCSRTAFP
jgi:hypothetical protein